MSIGKSVGGMLSMSIGVGGGESMTAEVGGGGSILIQSVRGWRKQRRRGRQVQFGREENSFFARIGFREIFSAGWSTIANIEHVVNV